MTELAFQIQSILLCKGVKREDHGKAPIHSDWNRIRACHIMRRCQQCTARSFLFDIDGSLDLHCRKTAFIRHCLCLSQLNITLVSADFLFQRRNLIWKRFCDLILQCISLAQMACFQHFQPLNCNVQIHLFLDIRITGTKCFHLGIR